jgi:hypothetical protein
MLDRKDESKMILAATDNCVCEAIAVASLVLDLVFGKESLMIVLTWDFWFWP